METDSYTYILASRRNGAIYVGVTTDLLRRTYEHKCGNGGVHTRRYNIKMLVWYEAHPNIMSAIQREKRLKKYPRQWKINLIEAGNAGWRDLYWDVCGG